MLLEGLSIDHTHVECINALGDAVIKQAILDYQNCLLAPLGKMKNQQGEVVKSKKKLNLYNVERDKYHLRLFFLGETFDLWANGRYEGDVLLDVIDTNASKGIF